MPSNSTTDIDSFDAYLASTDEKRLIGDILAEKVLSSISAKNIGIRRIFDLGCGSGEISTHIIQALDKPNIQYEYDALDPSGERLAKFKNNIISEDARRIHLFEEKFSENYQPSHKYDVLIACQSLYYFEDLRKIIEKILVMSEEAIIVHHGSTGLEEFEAKYKDFMKKSMYGTSTYLDVRTILDSINSENKYVIDFKNILCSVDIAACKDSNSPNGQALLSFFLGNDVRSLPAMIQKEMALFIDAHYPDFIQREQGIFFIKHK